MPEGGNDSTAAEMPVARSFNPNTPTPSVPANMMAPPAAKAKSPGPAAAAAVAAAAASANAKSPGGKRKRKQSDGEEEEEEEDPFASFAKEGDEAKRGGKKQRTADDEGAKGGKKQKKEKGEEGYLSDDEILTEAEEDIEDALIELMEEVIREWGDDPVDGYVCWARPDGFPWWPAQLITLIGMDPKTMKQIVAQYKEGYAKTHVLCMFLGDRPDFAWVHKERLRHFARGRQESMPPKKHAKYRAVMKALSMADKIDNDPRDMPPEVLAAYKTDAKKMLGELDAVLLQQRIFIRETTRRIERVLDPSLLEKDAEAAKNLPIWARG